MKGRHPVSIGHQNGWARLIFLGTWLLVFGLPNMSFAQAQTYAFRITFSDKNGTNFNLSNPQLFLSTRALNRRNMMNIPVDSMDLPVSSIYIDSVCSLTNGNLHVTSKWMNSCVIFMDDTAQMEAARQLPFVVKTDWVGLLPGSSNPLSNLPEVTPPVQRPLDYDDQYYGLAWTQIDLCKGEDVHQAGFEGNGSLIAVIDAGFEGVNENSAFDYIRNSGKILDRWNFVKNVPVSNDEGGHGTAVFSIMSVNLPNQFVGVAPEASYLLYTSENLEIEQPIEFDNWVAAAERADSMGADYITTSLGYNTFDPPFTSLTPNDLDGKTTFIARGLNRAVQKGIVVFASAGNEGNTSWGGLLTPGDADSAITVGAVDQNNVTASFSSHGPNAAGILKPDFVALGEGTNFVNQSGAFFGGNGTSYATPILAGLTACVFPNSHVTSAYIRNILQKSSDHYLNPNNLVGYGLPNFGEALNLFITGIDEIPPYLSSNFEILVYPNPLVDNNLNFVLPKSQPKFEAVIFDAKGQLVLSKNFHHNSGLNFHLDLKGLPAGSYRLILFGNKDGVLGQAAFLKR